jgi:hypothetical protein
MVYGQVRNSCSLKRARRPILGEAFAETPSFPRDGSFIVIHIAI